MKLSELADTVKSKSKNDFIIRFINGSHFQQSPFGEKNINQWD